MKDFKLEDHEKISPGFQVPDGYFDSLSEKINEKISNETTKVIPLHARRKSWFYAAAAILVAGLGIMIFNSISTNQTIPDETAIENYLASQPVLTEELLVELLEEEDIEKMEIGSNLDAQTIEDVLSRNGNLEQYIIN